MAVRLLQIAACLMVVLAMASALGAIVLVASGAPIH